MAGTFNDKIVVFRSDAVDAVKAINEIDNEGYIRVEVHESIVTVNFLSKNYNRFADETELLGKITSILKKYNIEHKIKLLVF